MARIKVALRRQSGPGHKSFVLGDLAIDYEKRLVTVAGRPVRLTATEYGLLRALSLDAGGRKAEPYHVASRRDTT